MKGVRKKDFSTISVALNGKATQFHVTEGTENFMVNHRTFVYRRRFPFTMKQKKAFVRFVNPWNDRNLEK